MATELEPKRTRGRPRKQDGDKPAAPVQALDRGLALLAELARTDAVTLTDLATRTGIAASTAHRLLGTLELHGVAAFNGVDQTWSIGVEAFRIGNAFPRRASLANVGREPMRWLMEMSGETANMAIADDGDVVFISQVETHHAIRAFFRPGTRGHMHASGIGKALLAHFSSEELDRIVAKRGLPSFTSKTLTTRAALQADLTQIAGRGWSFDDEERNEGMRCLAAPIFNEFGEAVAGVSISGPAVRMTDATLTALSPLVVEAAFRITTALGGVKRVEGRQA